MSGEPGGGAGGRSSNAADAEATGPAGSDRPSLPQTPHSAEASAGDRPPTQAPPSAEASAGDRPPTQAPPSAEASAGDRPPPPSIPAIDEANALRRLREASEALIGGVGSALPTWAARSANFLLSAWGGLDEERRQEVVAAAGEAGEQAARRVAGELGELLALDPAEQRATPLEIIRSAVAEPTAVLAAAGLPDVVRDAFEERAWPDDRFGLVPRTLRDLDPDLAAIHFAWGIAKTAVLRARSEHGDPPR